MLCRSVFVSDLCACVCVCLSALVLAGYLHAGLCVSVCAVVLLC